MGKVIYNNPTLKERRRELRHYPTKAEVLLWQRLNKQQLEGYRFFRQYSAGIFILDFYCPKLRLAIEVDGSHHVEKKSMTRNALHFSNLSILLQYDFGMPRYWAI